MKKSHLLKICKCLLFTAVMCLASTMLFAQDGDYSNYLYNSRQLVANGDCRGALNQYIIYVRLADQTDKELETQIAQCFEDNAAKAAIPVQQVTQPLYVKDYEVYQNGKKLTDNEVRRLFANTESYDLYDKGMNLVDKDFSTIRGLNIGVGTTSIVAGAVLTCWWIGVYTNQTEAKEAKASMEEYMIGGTDAPSANHPWYDHYVYYRNEYEQKTEQAEKDRRIAKPGPWLIGGGIVLLAVAETLIEKSVISSGQKKIRKSVDLYNNNNRALRSQNVLEIDYGLTGNGVFLTFSF